MPSNPLLTNNCLRTAVNSAGCGDTGALLTVSLQDCRLARAPPQRWFQCRCCQKFQPRRGGTQQFRTAQPKRSPASLRPVKFAVSPVCQLIDNPGRNGDKKQVPV